MTVRLVSPWSVCQVHRPNRESEPAEDIRPTHLPVVVMRVPPRCLSDLELIAEVENTVLVVFQDRKIGDS